MVAKRSMLTISIAKVVTIVLCANLATTQRPPQRVGTFGDNKFDFVKAEETGEWDEEWDGVPLPSFRSHAVLTPINKWYKFACTPEAIKDNRHYFCDEKGRIRCLPGWQNEKKMCKVPDCTVNNRTCVNGNCSSPFICDCNIGWTGQHCEKCVRLPGCVNGYCETSFQCKCHEGYEGMTCEKAICEGCVHGDCHMPGMCACHPGWTGPNCTECVKRSSCEYGRCVNRPFECQCYSGYKGITCEIPVCKVGCNETGGYCQHPELCNCRDGYEGEECSQCMKRHGCQNGYCNEPFECICFDGWKGHFCDTQDDIDGNWGAWEQWTDCDPVPNTRKCMRKRLRYCQNPAPKGDGKYCSLDGSSCEENERCFDCIYGNERRDLNIL